MFNPFKRLAADPSRVYKEKFTRLSDKNILKTYTRGKGNSSVESVSGLDSVVRFNSTYLEVVDKLYFIRGVIALGGGFVFGMLFIGGFLWPVLKHLFMGAYPDANWIALIIVWILIVFPLSYASFRLIITEFFFSTYYPIRMNRKNQMVYIYQADNKLLEVPWRNITFVLGKNSTRSWSVFGCVTDDGGDIITTIIPLPARLNWGQDSLDIFWEFIRCYMEEDDEYLPDLADTIAWCPPVEKQKEGWLFGLLYLYKQYVWQGLIINLPLFPLVLLISTTRWLVMLTCKIPQWPAEVEAACRPDASDPVNIGAEHNPPQLWRPMLALQSKEGFARTFAKERGAMDRIIARLKAKYGEQGQVD